MNNRFEGGDAAIEAVIALGTSTVNTLTKVVGVVHKPCMVLGVRFHGQAAVTATTLTAEVFARSTVGGSGASIQAAVADVEFASAALAKAGVAADPTATQANKYLEPGQLLEVVITADTCSAGPGDLLVEVLVEPRYRTGRR